VRRGFNGAVGSQTRYPIAVGWCVEGARRAAGIQPDVLTVLYGGPITAYQCDVAASEANVDCMVSSYRKSRLAGWIWASRNCRWQQPAGRTDATEADVIDRLELANQVVREQLEARHDIVGALVCGSVARGEATDTSDVDLLIYTKEQTGEGLRSSACWREEVFIETQISTAKGLGSLEETMGDPLNATRMNDAMILYDPTGFLGELQDQVRAVFMQEKWLRMRLNFALELCRTNVARLRESTADKDCDGICQAVWWISHAVPAVPLYIAGVTPSSTRKLSQLASVCPGIRERVTELECSLPLTASDFAELLDTCRKLCTLKDPTVSSGLVDYMMVKAESMASHGALSEAVDVVWCALQAGGPVVAESWERARGLRQEWLCGVGWSGDAVVKGKLRSAGSLLRQVEDMAATEPPDGGAASQ